MTVTGTAFLASWSAAMAAMMLPSELPLLRLHYATTRSVPRLAALGTGYLGVWLTLAAPVWLADRAAGGRLLASRIAAVALALGAVAWAI